MSDVDYTPVVTLFSRRITELEEALQALLNEPVIDAEQWAGWAQDLARFVLEGEDA